MGIPPVKASTGIDASLPIATFHPSSLAASVLIPNVGRELILNCEQLCRVLTDLGLEVQCTLQKHRERHRNQVGKGYLHNFTESDSILVCHEDLATSRKISFLWCGPRRVIRPANG